MKIHYTLKVGDNIMKILLLTFDKHEEKAIDKILGIAGTYVMQIAQDISSR